MARKVIVICALDSGPHIHRCRRIFWSLLGKLLMLQTTSTSRRPQRQAGQSGHRRGGPQLRYV